MTLLSGVVIKSTGSWYQVKKDDRIYDCRIIGKFRLGKLKVTNPVAVGDIVHFELEEEEKGIIKEIENRTNYVVRQSPRKKHFVHLLASNVDQAMLIITIAQPKLKQGFIDRFLMMTEPYDIPVHIVFNKSDVYSEGDLSVYNYLKEIYETIGYTVSLISNKTEEGIDKVKEILSGKQTLIAGQSGVGKSTLVNNLIEHINLKTQEVSDYTGKGQHTTTFAEMFFIDEQTSIIDTPGIKTLSFNFLEEQDILHNFREIFAKSEDCKFGDCSHRNEPKCAVKDSVESGEISELRYMNYLQILEDTEDQNYWERHKDI
jgi:ribosome biogenesis GTPase